MGAPRDVSYEAAVCYTGLPYPRATKLLDWAHQIETLMEQGLLPKHRLLEVGAGCLGIGKRLIEYLEVGNYSAVEPNDWLCKASEVPGHLYHLYTFDDFKLSRIPWTFDYVFAHSVLTHADYSQVHTLLSEAFEVLWSGGMLIASFFDTGCGNSNHEGWMYPGGCSYTTGFITFLAQVVGFEVETKRDPRHPIKHSWLFARKP